MSRAAGILLLSSRLNGMISISTAPPKVGSSGEYQKGTGHVHQLRDRGRELQKPACPAEDHTRSAPFRSTYQTLFRLLVEEFPRPGVFFPEKAIELGVPRGHLWSKLQGGETVISASGREVSPGEVMGGARKGRKFSFVTDTGYVPDAAAEVAGSDLFICEGMFTDEFSESAASKKHLTARQAGMIARQAGGIKQMG
jgi:ribonuclease Z